MLVVAIEIAPPNLRIRLNTDAAFWIPFLVTNNIAIYWLPIQSNWEPIPLNTWGQNNSLKPNSGVIFSKSQVPIIVRTHPINIINLAPNIFSNTPTKGPMPIHDNPITETITPISQGPRPLTSPKNTGNKNIGA